MPDKSHLILTCEHGGNKVPRQYRNNFDPQVLKTHRGWDIGALQIAKKLKTILRAPLLYSETSRLLVDLNRSVGRPGIFSEFTPPNREPLLDEYYHPYRERAETLVRQKTKAGHTLFHFSIHSFTPRLQGETRNCEIGLLYDPRREGEREICAFIKRELKSTDLRVRLNYPYKGIADGLPTYLRKKYRRYHGVEIELNQDWLQRKRGDGFTFLLAKILKASLRDWESRNRK